MSNTSNDLITCQILNCTECPPAPFNAAPPYVEYSMAKFGHPLVDSFFESYDIFSDLFGEVPESQQETWLRE